ncbi:MAG: hypothetical protein LUG90_07585 [Clostridiaceae bacterium]|nr:hypothetical protein [Clostridiaceae bacterium]
MNDILPEEIQRMLDFINAATEAVKNDYTAEFACPLCGEKAYASKASSNGHVHAYCSKCDANFIE